jgi:hypothetical protein
MAALEGAPALRPVSFFGCGDKGNDRLLAPSHGDAVSTKKLVIYLTDATDRRHA